MNFGFLDVPQCALLDEVSERLKVAVLTEPSDYLGHGNIQTCCLTHRLFWKHVRMRFFCSDILMASSASSDDIANGLSTITDNSALAIFSYFKMLLAYHVCLH